MIGTDLIVVGGGPSGLATAIEARLKGLTVTLLEKRTPPIDQACGEGIMPGGVEILHGLGVEVPWSERYPFRGIRYLHQDLEVVGTFPQVDGLGVRRIALHQAMADRAESLGVDLRWGEKVLDYRDQRVRTQGGEFESRWVVAADGRRSMFRKLLSPPGKKPARSRFGIRRHFEVEPWTDYVEVYWAKGCQANVTPVGPKRVNIALMWSGEKGVFDTLFERFPRLQKRVKGGTVLSEDRGAGPFGAQVRRVASHDLALVGDAAGSLDPISGYGLENGFREATAVVRAMETGDLAGFQRESNRLRRVPRTMTNMLLLLDRYPAFRHRVMRSLQRTPAIMDRMLSIHVGLEPPTYFRLRDLCWLLWGILR